MISIWMKSLNDFKSHGVYILMPQNFLKNET